MNGMLKTVYGFIATGNAACRELIFPSSLLLLISSFSSCTKDITVELPPPEEKIVVEGYIEQGQAPYVLLSRNSAFFGGIDVNDLEQYIVRGAVVTVSDITDVNKIATDTLDEICIDTTIGDQTVTVCAYRSFNPTIFGELRKTYSLRVAVDSIVLTAKTVIPDLLKLDSLWYEPHEDPENDTLVNVFTKFKDPDTLGNYIRYFSKRNSEEFYYVFVTDDRFFNGQDFELPLQRGQDPDEGFDQDTYGYFWRGDTVVIKWVSISKATYDFWNTLDYETNSGGPFGSATVIKTNIEGGLGIWGGYAAYYDTLYIPE